MTEKYTNFRLTGTDFLTGALWTGFEYVIDGKKGNFGWSFFEGVGVSLLNKTIISFVPQSSYILRGELMTAGVDFALASATSKLMFHQTGKGSLIRGLKYTLVSNATELITTKALDSDLYMESDIYGWIKKNSAPISGSESAK
jgi:hypothetical protein